MPTAHVVVESPVKRSFRVDQLAGMFDVSLEEKLRHEWDISLPIDDRDWRIGVIVGPSGSGKTVVSRAVFGDAAYHTGFEWDDRAVIDNFPREAVAQDITSALSSVGFSSPPSWVKPFAVLSNGEKFRAELARLMFDERELVIVDEFTSVVDRTVAQIGSAAFARSVRRAERSPRFVLLSCHYDVLEWLAPDWILDMQTRDFQWAHLQRPGITLDVHKVGTEAWRLFAPHHYLSAALNPSAQCFVAFWNGTPVAFNATLPQMGVKNMRRASRTVVLPDYQGVGIGQRFVDAIASWYKRQGIRYVTTTGHPARIAALAHSPNWRVTDIAKQGKPKVGKTSKFKGMKASTGRAVVSAEYVGA